MIDIYMFILFCVEVCDICFLDDKLILLWDNCIFYDIDGDSICCDWNKVGF